jgi:hypothetical protein
VAFDNGAHVSVGHEQIPNIHLINLILRFQI